MWWRDLKHWKVKPVSQVNGLVKSITRYLMIVGGDFSRPVKLA